MNYHLAKVLLATVVSAIGLLSASNAHAQIQASGENISLHQKVTVDPNSNYQLTKNKSPEQLTNGIYASTGAKWDPINRTSSLWVQEGAITWVHVKPVVITIDLGKVQPISGISYSTAAGIAGATWPTAIYLATSDDGKTWHYAGDVVQLSEKQPQKEGYANFRYISHDIKTHGQYISLGIIAVPSITVDEIEVYRGDDALLKSSAGNEIPVMKDFVTQEIITSKAQNRLNADINSIRALFKNAELTSQLKSTFEARLDKDAAATKQMPPLSADFKTIIPLDNIHRDILAVHGESLAAQGFKPLTVWKQHRYAWLPVINVPQIKQSPALEISMLKNQFRSDALLLTNASGEPMTVKVLIQNVPKNAKPGWLQLDSAVWTDTLEGVPVHDALIPIEQQNGIYGFQIPAGITGKLWVTVDSSKVLSGTYKSTFLITAGNQKADVPLNLNTSKIAMPAPRMSPTVWEYTNGKGLLGITPKNRDAAIRLLRSHFVNSPWATNVVLPTPTAADFNAKNELTAEVNFSELDQWISMWPHARRYFVAYDVTHTDTFAGANMGTPEFNAKVGSWIKVMAAHFVQLGLKPSQLFLALVDESQTDDQDLHLVSWGKPIKAAAPEVGIWSDPVWADPTKSKYPEAFTIPDILCPLRGRSAGSRPFYEKLKCDDNKELWLYNADEPGKGRLGDPQLNYRQMAWSVFAFGGKSEGFWSFGDICGAPTSWNAYVASRPIYAPAFIDTNTVYNSVHWDAVRDGVEDFEELSMLADAIKNSKKGALKMQAQQVLDDAVKAVNDDAGNNKNYQWSQNTDPSVVDAQLQKVQAMLERLKVQ